MGGTRTRKFREIDESDSGNHFEVRAIEIIEGELLARADERSTRDLTGEIEKLEAEPCRRLCASRSPVGTERDIAARGEAMAKARKVTRAEWVGGVISMPAYVTGEGEPYRPEALLWLGANGAVLGSTVVKPGERLSVACTSLQSTIERPMVGRAHSPVRVRVASQELANALRDGFPGLEVLCAPTPEIDLVAAAMREHLGDHEATEHSYLSPDVGADMVASFFRSAARLFRAAPWTIVPGDHSVISVTIEQFNLREAALSVIGQMGESLGFILFSNIDDQEAFADAAEAFERGEEPDMPPHFALNFDRGADLSPSLRKEIAEHDWEVANSQAFPWLVSVDSDLVARPATAEEVQIAEAVCLALCVLLEEKAALSAAWSGAGPAVTRTVKVCTYLGDVDVTLRAPHEPVVVPHAPFDVIADLFELTKHGEAPEPDARAPLEAELLRRFENSPEARGLSELGFCQLLMDFAADYFLATIATLDAADLREVVFGIVPHKVSIEASAASGIIAELRAFYGFLKREFGLRQADACLRVLGRDAVKKLEAELSNTSNFGMAKSLIMAGAAAGFDMGTQQGIDAWMREASSKPLPASHLPPLGGPARPSEKKRAPRKTARKARKRNR